MPAALKAPKAALLFRAQPPRELLLRIVEAVGLSLRDLRWFGRAELRLAGLADWLAELEPYYFPCKARRFFYGRGELGADAVLVVLRHLLPLEGYQLQAQEKGFRDQKQTLYQISPVDRFQSTEADGTPPSLTVDFS
jgi:hypothetical protein